MNARIEAAEGRMTRAQAAATGVEPGPALQHKKNNGKKRNEREEEVDNIDGESIGEEEEERDEGRRQEEEDDGSWRPDEDELRSRHNQRLDYEFAGWGRSE